MAGRFVVEQQILAEFLHFNELAQEAKHLLALSQQSVMFLVLGEFVSDSGEFRVAGGQALNDRLRISYY